QCKRVTTPAPAQAPVADHGTQTRPAPGKPTSANGQLRIGLSSSVGITAILASARAARQRLRGYRNAGLFVSAGLSDRPIDKGAAEHPAEVMGVVAADSDVIVARLEVARHIDIPFEGVVVVPPHIELWAMVHE